MRSPFILYLSVLLIVGCTTKVPVAPTEMSNGQGTLAHAAEWLWAQQAEDGGWHSQTYGLLKSGQALTPFILHSLLEVPEEVVARPPGAVDRALVLCHFCCDGWYPLGRRSRKTDLPGRVSWRSDIE